MIKLKYNADDTLKPFIHATDEIEKIKKQVEELRDKLAYSDAWVNEAKDHYEPIIRELREALDETLSIAIAYAKKIKPERCCDGYMCACMGKPTNYEYYELQELEEIRQRFFLDAKNELKLDKEVKNENA